MTWEKERQRERERERECMTKLFGWNINPIVEAL